MLFLDTETCGLHSQLVLIQYSEEEGEISLYNVWTNPAGETRSLIHRICEKEICGFNLAFDWFHINKFYNVISCLNDDEYPEDNIDKLYEYEKQARNGKCLKPKSALDLMCYGRKGPYQTLMDRENVKIRRIPTALSQLLADKLEEKVLFRDIYFQRAKVQGKRWKVEDTADPMFKDIVLRYKPSSSLKSMAADALGIEVTTFDQISNKAYPLEYGYRPFGGDWNLKIKTHIDHWSFDSEARKYAAKDVEMTRDLWKFFGSPPAGDTDSLLTCMVGAVRWKGYKVDIEKLKQLINKTEDIITSAPRAPRQVKAYIEGAMTDLEKAYFNTTKKTMLEELATLDGEVGIRASNVINARRAEKEVNLYQKLVNAERFHASFKVVGTLSSRMSGSDGLNAQGINRDKNIRACFPLADDGYVLCGGDFDAFEVALAEAAFNDEGLRKTLLSGEKIHTLFAMELFGKTKEEIEKSKGTKNDMYLKGKSGIFAMIYGGEAYTLNTKLGVPMDVAERAFRDFGIKYPGVARCRMEIFERFCSMRQPKGIGTKVEWHDPQDYIESLFGFRRYFTLENRVCKALFELGEKPPEEWRRLKFKVQRRDREQTAYGATQSALFGAAFGIQASNMRAANNHLIQSSGATLTKELQRRIWDLQPVGIHDWVVQPMNIHDEIMVVAKPEITKELKDTVDQFILEYKSKVPLLAMSWKTGLKNWGEK